MKGFLIAFLCGPVAAILIFIFLEIIVGPWIDRRDDEKHNK